VKQAIVDGVVEEGGAAAGVDTDIGVRLPRRKTVVLSTGDLP
jgi:hypothetical protein